MDKLEQIFDEQNELNVYTAHGNKHHDLHELMLLWHRADETEDQEIMEWRSKWVANYATAMIHECAELRDSTNWKWWRSKVDLYDPQNVKVELIDILHFWVSACQVMGMSADDVYQIYMQKNAVNHARQKSGYKVKVEDCKHIGLTDAELDAAVESAAEKADGRA